MIDLPAMGVNAQPGFVSEDPRFQVDSPTGNPLMAITPLAFAQREDAIEATPVEKQVFSREAETFLDRLIAEARRQVERYPARPSVHTNLGLALLNGGQLEEAVSAFEVALTLDPGQYLPQVSLVRIKVLQGRLEEAEESYLQM